MQGINGVAEESPILIRDKNGGKISIKSINIQQIDGNERWELIRSTETVIVEKLLGYFLGKQIWTPYGWEDIIGVQRSLDIKGVITTKVVSNIGVAELTDKCQVMCSDRKWKKASELKIGDKLASTFPGFGYRSGFRERGGLPDGMPIKYAKSGKVPDAILNDSVGSTMGFLKEYCDRRGYTANNIIKGQKLYYLLRKLHQTESEVIIKYTGQEYRLELEPKTRANQNQTFQSVTELIKDFSTNSWIYSVQTASGVFQAGIGGLVVKSE